MRASAGERHISGAEGIYRETEVTGTVTSLLDRALSHARGVPDEVRIKITRLSLAPVVVRALPVVTVRNERVGDAREFISACLLRLGISGRAADAAFSIVYGGEGMRGAAVISMSDGRRMDADRSRGVRVTNLGITDEAGAVLARRLGEMGLDTTTVKEALVLASKVSAHDAVVAELCVSDDPDYLTGYVASGKFGYARIPAIKEKGSESGGRVFFVREDTDMEELTDYLQEVPVMVNGVSAVHGEISKDEFLGRLDS